MSEDRDSISLRDFMTMKFSQLEKRLDELCNSIICPDRFDIWCNRVSMVERQMAEHDERIDKAERSLWLMQIIVGVLVPIIVAVLIALLNAWITGTMEVRFNK